MKEVSVEGLGSRDHAFCPAPQLLQIGRDSPASTLPAAAATGKLTLQPNAVVYRTLKGEDGKASGVSYIDALTNEALDVNAKVVMVCASSLESTRLLMLSGIGRSSGALGHYLMDHTIDCGAWGYLPRPQGGKVTEWDDKRANGIYVPRFRNLKEKRKDYIRGYGFQGEAATSMYPAHAHRVRGFGTARIVTPRKVRYSTPTTRSGTRPMYS